MQEEGTEGEVGKCAGPVKVNSVTSSLLQNYSDAKVIEKIIFFAKMEFNILFLTVHKFLREK